MGFFEDELRKIMGPRHPDATYVGRACYVKLGPHNGAKLEFVTLGVADHYVALRASILNQQEGIVDVAALRFSDLLGTQSLADGYKGNPYVWICDGKAEWYGYEPDKRAYQVLSDSIEAYLEVFQEQEQTAPSKPVQETGPVMM